MFESEDRGDWVDELVAGMVELVPGGSLVSGPIAKLTKAARREHGRRRSVAIAAAVELSGLGSAEDLAEAVADDPDLIPLLTRVLYAAGMNGYDEVLEILGAALGSAVADRDRVDEVSMILASLENLTRLHIQVLGAATIRVRQVPDTFDLAELLDYAEGIPEEHVKTALAGLVANGLVETVSLYGALGWRVTRMGHRVLRLIHTYRDRRQRTL
jgi:hypothetical protein